MIKKYTIMVVALVTLVAYTSIPAVAEDTVGKKIVVETEAGSLNLKQLIDACPEIAKSVSSQFVNKKIPGQIIKMNDKKYEIRYFGFEDTSGKTPESLTFREYITLNKLLDMQSLAMDPLPGIHFESFDYRRTKLDDGVYFSMAVKLVEK